MAEYEVDVRFSRPVRVPEQPSVAPHDTDRVDAIAVPVPDDRDVTRFPVFDDEIGTPRAFHLTEEPHQIAHPRHAMTGVAHHPDRPHPRIGEVPDNRVVAGEAEIEGLVGRPAGQGVA